MEHNICHDQQLVLTSSWVNPSKQLRHDQVSRKLSIHRIGFDQGQFESKINPDTEHRKHLPIYEAPIISEQIISGTRVIYVLRPRNLAREHLHFISIVFVSHDKYLVHVAKLHGRLELGLAEKEKPARAAIHRVSIHRRSNTRLDLVIAISLGE